MNTYKTNKYWYLGFLGFIGFYKLPEVLLLFQQKNSIWEFTDLLWFLWFLNFLPKKNKTL